MSIASGTPLPRVYVLEEPAINAFAAGVRAHRRGDRGLARRAHPPHARRAARAWSRMSSATCSMATARQNIQLIGWAFGLLVLGHGRGAAALPARGAAAVGGRVAARSCSPSWRSARRWWWSATSAGGSPSCSRPASSCQREYLADASAVQFTRNPEGIGGALKKLGLHSYRSMVVNHDAHAGQPHVPGRRRAVALLRPVRHPPAAGGAHPRHRSALGRQMGRDHADRADA